MDAWEAKAHRIISHLAKKAHEDANPKRGKKHKPYRLPDLACALVTALGDNDENKAKALFLSYEGLKSV